jgi:hypothetical protein
MCFSTNTSLHEKFTGFAAVLLMDTSNTWTALAQTRITDFTSNALNSFHGFRFSMSRTGSHSSLL